MARWTEQQVNALLEQQAKKGNKPKAAPLPPVTPGKRKIVIMEEIFEDKVKVIHIIPGDNTEIIEYYENMKKEKTINIPEGISYELWKYIHDELNVAATEGQLLDIIHIVKQK